VAAADRIGEVRRYEQGAVRRASSALPFDRSTHRYKLGTSNNPDHYIGD